MSDADRGNIRVRAVTFIEQIKGITEARAKNESDIAGGTLVTMQIKKDGQDSWGWYFEKGEVKKALFTGEEIARYIGADLDKSIIKTIASSFSSTTHHAVSFRFLGIALFIFYIGMTFSKENTFVFLVAMGISIFLISIAARVYFSGFTAPDVLPEKDRDLLESIIKENGKDGLETYIRLSSLSGFTGNITKLGLSGLPLLTVAMTIFFTSLAALLWALAEPDNRDGGIVSNLLDLSKLTLGAFIGSFVQRNVSATNAARQGQTIP